MRSRLFVLSVALILSALSLHSQTATLSGTITDTDTNAWNGAQMLFNLNNPVGTRPVVCATGVGVPVQVPFTTNSSGAISGTITRNDAICPAGTTYTIQACPFATSGCQTLPQVNIAASTYNAGAYISTNINAPRFTCNKDCYGYGTVEVNSPVNPGSIFYNVLTGASPVCNISNGSTWAGCGAGSGSVNSVTPGVGLNNSGTGTDPILNCTTTQTNGQIGCGFVPIITLGTPTATCNFGNRGQLDIDITDVTINECIALPGPTFQWVVINAFNTTQWNGVTATNTPGTNSNWACVSNGTNNSCTWGTVSGGGNYVALGTYPITASASISMMTRNAVNVSGNLFQSDFDYYVMVIEGMQGTTVLPSLEFSTNGTTCDTSASDYQWVSAQNVGGTINGSSNTANGIQFHNATLSTLTNTVWSATVYIYNPLDTTAEKNVIHQSFMVDSGAGIIQRWGGGRFLPLLAETGACFTSQGGSSFAANGTIHVYGVSH